MLDEVLLAQFVLHCNSFTHIAHRSHHIIVALTRYYISYVHMHAYVGGYVVVNASQSCHLYCLTLTAKVLQAANLSSAAQSLCIYIYNGAQLSLFSKGDGKAQ